MAEESHTDCRSVDGETVLLIDSAIITLRLISRRSLESQDVKAALADLLADREVAIIIRSTELSRA